MKSIVALFSIILAFSPIVQAQASISAEQKAKLSSDMDYIGQIFSQYYAPKSWKESHLGWNLTAQVQKAKADIQNANTIQEYRGALTRFLKSTSDYHVGFSFFSTEAAILPFQVKTIDGKTIFVFINRQKLPEATFPFHTGDELIAMDGVSVTKILNGLKAELGSNIPGTDAAVADLYLSSRSGRRNNLIPNSVVTLTILRQGETKSIDQQLAWEYFPETIPGETNEFTASNPSITRRMMVSLEAQQLMTEQTAENNFGLGLRNSFLPDFGERIWETDATNPFDAYIYKNEEGKLIGVVRIGSYVAEDYSATSKAFAGIISRFQKVTDGMVINQLNNPGGSVFYLYGLASMLTDTAISTPRHRMVITSSDINDAVLNLARLKNVTNDEEAVKALGGSDVDGYPLNFEYAVAARNYCNFLISQWNQGKKITDPYFISGVDKINPHPTSRYTKPIVLLVNELDFSGGDFFPAILQDNKRVTVVGTRTAGAGGYVGQMTIPNSFGLQVFTVTGSIAERVDLNPIENLGVTPDVPLAITLDDYRNNFASYVNGVKSVIKNSVGP